MAIMFTKSFSTFIDAISDMANISATISDAISMDDIKESLFAYELDETNVRREVLKNLAANIIANTPDVHNEAYPQVPTFNVNAHDFFYRTPSNIGFGINHDKFKDTWNATITLYIRESYIDNNSLVNILRLTGEWEERVITNKSRDRRRNERYQTKVADLASTNSNTTTYEGVTTISTNSTDNEDEE